MSTNANRKKKIVGSPAQSARRSIGITDVLEVVAAHYGVSPADLTGKRRSRTLTLPRQVAMYLIRELTCLSLEEIGQNMGGREHFQALEEIRAIRERRCSESDLDQILSDLTARLQRGLSSGD